VNRPSSPAGSPEFAITKRYINFSESEAGSEMALPFLFTSFGNHRLSDHLSIAE